ncbi:MAG: pyrroloquinoline quinone precursor peptide PqqA [Luminiphilus sp.]|nr:pyrroloquinoline quinone precursor peptide PqqA [Luminiphilus sp.]
MPGCRCRHAGWFSQICGVHWWVGSARCRVIGFGITLTDLDNFQIKESTMWTKPEYVDLRVGFEVTMYFSVR